MTESRRVAPDPGFVLQYRQGAPTSTIAAAAGVAETTVRYHLQIAAKADPGIRDEHKAALAPAPRKSGAGLRNLADVLAFHEAHGRLPVSHGKTARERALAAWLANRRRQAAEGTLSPTYRAALAVIPGWARPSNRKAEDKKRWHQRLEELHRIRAAGGDWPRHQKTDDQVERTLGVWLHGQRIDYRAGRLDPAKEQKLNILLPGWREGRGHRGGRRGTHSRP
ncbi:DNA-binding CsgD family transcriptional regulator [Arthrobacter oryzae]|uniref:helicase associated domain-containing protein n=1 Tax=Arthrobacter TaxID=1663 RepID=UPI001F382AF1|nr:MULTISPECIES: helicase associated domain-containing protein [Arthrobacter]MDP9988773.1 DNA-binding CsgD family transcriptional regulator [Arthrobacter oryzae]UKA71385.1 helicase associated domain-containing protein [Arthrobacter sp. FW306-06-A]